MRKRPAQQPLEIGEPEKTPFVRFDAGIVYPPNNIYESAQSVLDGLKSQDALELFNSLIKKGVVHGQYRVLPDSTWYAVLNNFLHYHARGASNQRKSIDSCVRALQIMIKRPCEDAWRELRDYLIEGIDELSGWNSSFDRRIAEEQQVFQGEDGNYHYRDADGEPVQIVGAETTQETRLDFILSQLLVRTGFLRQFLGLFSLFAIADDFERNRAHYHTLIKAVLPESEGGPIECRLDVYALRSFALIPLETTFKSLRPTMAGRGHFRLFDGRAREGLLAQKRHLLHARPHMAGGRPQVPN
jgi:hypothetical protein